MRPTILRVQEDELQKCNEHFGRLCYCRAFLSAFLGPPEFSEKDFGSSFCMVLFGGFIPKLLNEATQTGSAEPHVNSVDAKKILKFGACINTPYAHLDGPICPTLQIPSSPTHTACMAFAESQPSATQFSRAVKLLPPDQARRRT